MYQELSRLTLYSNLPEDCPLCQLARVEQRLEETADAPLTGKERAALTHTVMAQVKRLLDLATACGFDGNLWQNYLTWLIITHEDSFSLTFERAEPMDGSIRAIAVEDFRIFRRLFHWDFSAMEKALDIRALTLLQGYTAVPKREQMYNRAVSEAVRGLSPRIAAAQSPEEIYELVTAHYRDCGVGLFGLNRAFRVRGDRGSLTFEPIHNLDAVTLDALVGYDLQKKKLRANIEAFLSGRPFNNTLLYGDAGTGKSTSVKALLPEYGPRGLRVIELDKHQFALLQDVIAQVKRRHCRFIIFLDDLSFDEGEAEYKYLKAVIEGGLESRPDNVMICATSNRRHLVKETWKDRDDMEHDGDIHRSDTVEEKLSLSARFGCSINYSAPDRRLFDQIVVALAERHPEIHLSREQLLAAANRFELRHGGLSGRTAQQFINEAAGEIE